jgi:predicted transcriptional regulator of viral defense system
MEQNKIRELFLANGGYLRMSQAIEAGVSRHAFYALRDKGFFIQESRGLFRLSEQPDHPYPDLCVTSLRYPKAVFCLVSALSFHEATTQIPREVHIALPRGARTPVIQYPPLHTYFFSKAPYEAGIEAHQIEGVGVKIYDLEKTIIDCFKFRNQIGMDVFLEAIKLYKSKAKVQPARLAEYAKICGVEKAVFPYLEAIL